LICKHKRSVWNGTGSIHSSLITQHSSDTTKLATNHTTKTIELANGQFWATTCAAVGYSSSGLHATATDQSCNRCLLKGTSAKCCIPRTLLALNLSWPDRWTVLTTRQPFSSQHKLHYVGANNAGFLLSSICASEYHALPLPRNNPDHSLHPHR